tara:strand:- start:105 stop:308 length:204 start_codon:yes stop_codon:yes gene_type:complete
MKTLVDISDIDLPPELTNIIYTFAKKKDRTYRTQHARVINGLRFIRSRGNIFCLSKTGAPEILFPRT